MSRRGPTTALIALPYVGGLRADFPEIHNRVWYVPLKGGTEKTMATDER